ncbi:MAG: hypothetical protein K2Y56_25160 [Methylobacterium sp.]|uniref:hypothetical protein n=1 Tax=Methylobacterium sp. TaxID=409 RepID=UPI0025E96794|nr:hypothetical protein [Methylobacterium sp.]MBX9934761.1 hypothetical protein [Methylobacterium sp.]
MSARAGRDLAVEIGTMFQTDQAAKAISFIDALIEADDFSDIDRLRAANPGDGEHSIRNLLSRRIDSAPLAGGGMAAIFVVTVYNRPGPFDPRSVVEQVADSWGGGLLSIAVDRSFRGLDGVPRGTKERMALSRLCAERGPEAALKALPRVRRKPKRAWDPNFVVCAATTERDRDHYGPGSNILLDTIPDADALAWSADARLRWAGDRCDVGIPELLGSALEIARRRSVVQNIAVVSAWAGSGLVDLLRLPGGDLLVTSTRGGRQRIPDAGLLSDAAILQAAGASGAMPDLRRSISAARFH